MPCGQLATFNLQPATVQVSTFNLQLATLLKFIFQVLFRAVKLNFRRVDLQLAHPWAIARGTAATKTQVVIVELLGADGTQGLGEAPTASRYRESATTVEAFLKKVDPRGLSFNDVEGSMSYLDTLSAHDMSAKAALNVALLDGAARRAKQPIFDFLELGFRENQHVTSF